MATSNAIRTVADLDSGYPKPLDSASVPETNTSDQRNGLIGGQFFENLGQVRLCKVGGGHLRADLRLRDKGLAIYIPTDQPEGLPRKVQWNWETTEISPRPNLESI